MGIGASILASLPIYVDDSEKQSRQSIVTRARRWVKRHAVRGIVIDYLQLVETDPRRELRLEIGAITWAMKCMAKELGVTVILLSQLNRDFEKDKPRRPRLSDLRESGSIEQDADVVAMLYSPNKGDLDEESQPSGPVEVNMWIAKNRDGQAMLDVKFMFEKHLTRFVEWFPRLPIGEGKAISPHEWAT